MDDANALLPDVIDIARQTGLTILKYFKQDYKIVRKPDNTPVTDADIAANDFVTKRLTSLTPNIPILSEEGDIYDFATRKKWQIYWLIDPLDGTREFIKNSNEFSVNIALISQQKPILGVIHSPKQQSTYYATHGKAAWKCGKDGKAVKIQTRKIKDKISIISGINSYGSPILKQFMDNIPNCDLKLMGSSLKSCAVAEGNFDVYPRFGLTSEWDTAAAQCILEQAGGGLFDFNMKPLSYNTKDSLLNPSFLAIGDCDYLWKKLLPLESG